MNRGLRSFILVVLGALLFLSGLLVNMALELPKSETRTSTWAAVLAACGAVFATMVPALLTLRQLKYQVAIESGRAKVEYFNRVLYVCYDVVAAADRFVSTWEHIKPLSPDDSVEESPTRKEQRHFQVNEFVDAYRQQEREIQVALRFLDEFRRRGPEPERGEYESISALAISLRDASEALYCELLDKRSVNLTIAPAEFSSHPLVVRATDELAGALAAAVARAYDPRQLGGGA
jgi:hypothetical protein